MEEKKVDAFSKEWKAEYKELKTKQPDAVLLMSCGEYYFCYGEESKEVATIIGRLVTKEDTWQESYVGFLQSELDIRLPKLIRAGKRVAICHYDKD